MQRAQQLPQCATLMTQSRRSLQEALRGGQLRLHVGQVRMCLLTAALKRSSSRRQRQGQEGGQRCQLAAGILCLRLVCSLLQGQLGNSLLRCGGG